MTQAAVLAQMGNTNQTFRNRIINGAMMIDQRNAGASVTPTTSVYTLDRWIAIATQSSKFSTQQNAGSVMPPVGFKNYCGVTSLSAYSIGAGDIFGIEQGIEGFNVSDFAWGTANAQPVTVSFWVRSSLTGTFGGSVRNASYNRCYVFSYTINSSNTWEYKTITIAGDTTGTWATDNTSGLWLTFSFGTGSTYSSTAGWSSGNYTSATGATSVVGTNGATFYITGVQLELGTKATPFENRLYGVELALCQRYCYSVSLAFLGTIRNGSDTYNQGLTFPVTMRTTPTLQSGSSFTVSAGSVGSPVLATESSPYSAFLYNGSNNWTANERVRFTGTFTSEL